MKKADIENLIKQNADLENFIKGKKACLGQRIGNVEILIYKENLSTVSYYYQCPYDHDTDYSTVCEYMNYAIPILEELLEKSDDDKLFTSNCIR